MIYPSIDKILKSVDSKYSLVHIIAKRAKQMQETNHYQLPLNEYKNKKELSNDYQNVIGND